MSSTNRSNARDLHIADYYVTPINCIRDFFNAWIEDGQDKNKLKKMLFLDPCAGGDKKNAMSYPEFIKKELKANIDTIDIREDSLADKKEDFLLYNSKIKYDIIITNPPFNIALDIIKKSLENVREGGM